MEVQDTRFWSKVLKTDDCWLWQGSRNADGYGSMTRHRQSLKAHRYAWEMATGETLTRHDTICHVCDTPHCVRTDDNGTYRLGSVAYPRRGHLYKATQPANVADRDAKGRGNWATGDAHGTHVMPASVKRGVAHHHAILTDDDIRQIRATYTGKHGQLAALGRRFDTSPQNILAIVRGEAWCHVEGEALPVEVEVRRRDQRGGTHNMAKLNEQDVHAIRARVAGGEVQRHLAAEYGVSVTTICNIVQRKRWSHLN